MKVRSRSFKGRCSKHKRYNPAVDGAGGIKGGCPRCGLLLEIWESALKLNGLIRRFDPSHDDSRRPQPPVLAPDPRQLSLIE